MFESDKKIFIQETEVKPNFYATLVLLACILGLLFCWILTELGIFRTGKMVTRIGTVIPLVLIVPMLIALFFDRELYENPKTKYYIISIAAILSFTVTSLLTFHTTMMCLFPSFVAMLYKSRSIGKIAVVSSLICTIFSPIVGYLLSTWDIPLFEELILIGKNATIEYIGASDEKTWESVFKILLYLSLPRSIMSGACALLMYFVIGLSENNVKNQVLLNEISRRDAVTGLFNQNYFEEFTDNPPKTGTVGIIFYDVNDLKKLNDEKGHEAGNLLLERFGESIKRITDDETSAGFRVGGDEFLIIMPNAKEQTVLKKIDEWKESVAQINEENNKENNGIYVSAAYGYDVGRMANISDVINHADEKMYISKAEMKKSRE